MRRCTIWTGLALVVMAAACAVGERAPGSSRPMAVDEVANGLTAQPSANPLAGAFYNDGGDGDVVARSKNAFAQPEAPFDRAAIVETEPKADRMLIQRGSVRVEVAQPDVVGREFVAKITAWGGYLTSQQGAVLTLRVPAPRFEEAFAAAKALGRVLDEARQADDVTEEFVDLGIRLDNAKRSRDRLLEILQKAEKVEDILKVEAELRRLTEEIERMEGRRKFLADQVALATLQLALQATSQPPPGRRDHGASRFRWIGRVGAEAMMEGF